MKVYDRLLQDHAELRDLFAKLDNPSELAAFGRKELYRDIRLKLIAHDKAEEQTYYDAIGGDESVHDLVEDGRKDHQEVSRLLDALRSADPQDERWLADMCTVRDKFLKHAAEEEQEMIPRSRSVLSDDQAESIGQEFQNSELRLLMEERRQSPGA